MTDHDGFIHKIIENPDDDAPRLVYADWLEEHGEGERAEYIRVECEIGRIYCAAGYDDWHALWPPRVGSYLYNSHPRWHALQQRSTLLAAMTTHTSTCRTAIAELMGGAGGRNFECRFYRGFPVFVAMPAASFPGCADRLFASSPVHYVCLQDARDHAETIAGTPALGRLRGLQLEGHLEYDEYADWNAILSKIDLAPVGDRAVQTLVTSPYLKQLRSLNLYNCEIGPDGFQALARCDDLAGLRQLKFSHNRLGPDGLRGLASARFRRLRCLDLEYNQLGDAGVQALAGNALFHAPLLDIEQLILEHNQIGDEGVVALASIPFVGLRELYLGTNQIGAAGARALADSPHLRELRLLHIMWNRIGPQGLQALIDCFGSQRLVGYEEGHQYRNPPLIPGGQ